MSQEQSQEVHGIGVESLQVRLEQLRQRKAAIIQRINARRNRRLELQGGQEACVLCTAKLNH